jgi:hypothetical protein
MRVLNPLLVAGTMAWFASASPAFAQGATSASRTDFRGSNWGMTQAQVMATEPNRPAQLGESDGEMVVQYGAKLGALNGRRIYIFAGDKLVRAKFLAREEHSDRNEFIRDFQALESLLKGRYGKPADERAIWEDDSTQDETKNYLDQDRATPSSILPSDRFVGLAVELGHLRLYTLRDDGRTKVLHVLFGADHRITHQIEYRSVGLEKWEQDTRKSGPKAQ